jgi:hypothetical protein
LVTQVMSSPGSNSAIASLTGMFLALLGHAL